MVDMILWHAERNQQFGVQRYPVVVSSVRSNTQKNPLLVDAGNRAVTKAHCLFKFCVRCDHPGQSTLRAEEVRNESESLSKRNEGIERLFWADLVSKAHGYTIRLRNDYRLRLHMAQLSGEVLICEANCLHLLVLKSVVSDAARPLLGTA